MAAFDSCSGRVVSISQCPVCCDEYHPEECVPRLLRSCGHTFCETCLTNLQKSTSNSSAVRCPSCRVETAVEASKGVVECFPKNYALLENIENVKAAAAREAASLTTEKCEMCSERQAQFGCIECETKYCEGCWGVYHKVRALRSHEKVGLGDVFEAKCPNHPSKTAELVCLEPSCPAFGGLICLLCEKTTAHKGHLTEPIEQVAADKRKQLQVAISDAQKNVDYALSVLVKVQEADELLNGASFAGKGKGISSTGAPDKIQSNREKAIAIIDTTFRQLIAALEQRRAALIEEVGALVKTKSEKLEKQRTELCTFLSRSYTRLQDATQTVNRTNDRLFMASFHAHRDLLIETSHTKLFPEPVVTPLVDVVFAKDLMSEITSVGILNDQPVLQYPTSSTASLGPFVHTFGSFGQENGQFRCPSGLAFSFDRHLFVSDQLNHQIQVFRADGTFSRKFGSNGQGNGQFNNPRGLAFSPDGHLFVSDSGNHRIQVFRSDGYFLRKFGSGYKHNPNGLAFSPDGILFVSDSDSHRIHVFRVDGTFVRKFDSGYFNPSGLAFSPDGHLFVSDQANHRVAVFRPDGSPLRCFGSSGQGDGQFQNPSGLAFSPDGRLIVVDSGNHRIQEFQADGTFLRKFGSTSDSAIGVAFSPDGRLLVSDSGNHRIQMFRVDGTFVPKIEYCISKGGKADDFSSGSGFDSDFGASGGTGAESSDFGSGDFGTSDFGASGGAGVESSDFGSGDFGFDGFSETNTSTSRQS